MKKLSLLFCAGIFLSACVNQVESGPKKYFDLGNYMDSQSITLGGSAYEKYIRYEKDSTTADTSRYETQSPEFTRVQKLVTSYNLNLQNLIGSYAVDTIVQGDSSFVSYAALNDKLEIKKLRLAFYAGKLDNIRGKKVSKGFFSSYKENLRYQSTGEYKLYKESALLFSSAQTLWIRAVRVE